MWLALEKLFLTEEVTRQRVKNTNDSNTACHDRNDAAANYDLWEKRQLKAMTKLRNELLRTLQALQLHFEIKVTMMADD